MVQPTTGIQTMTASIENLTKIKYLILDARQIRKTKSFAKITHYFVVQSRLSSVCSFFGSMEVYFEDPYPSLSERRIDDFGGSNPAR